MLTIICFLDFDFGGDTQAPTRDDIKKRSKQLISANQKLPGGARKNALVFRHT